MGSAEARRITARTKLPVPVILWRDIFALVDQGHSQASDYPILERVVLEQAQNYPGGLACLVIIPATANPPPEDVRRAINDVLTRLAPKLRCLCWLVEGAGFRAAAVRATLTGLRMLNRQRYPTLVASEIDEAMHWMMLQLAGDHSRDGEVPTAVDAIMRERRSRRPDPFDL